MSVNDTASSKATAPAPDQRYNRRPRRGCVPRPGPLVRSPNRRPSSAIGRTHKGADGPRTWSGVPADGTSDQPDDLKTSRMQDISYVVVPSPEHAYSSRFSQAQIGDQFLPGSHHGEGPSPRCLSLRRWVSPANRFCRSALARTNGAALTQELLRPAVIQSSAIPATAQSAMLSLALALPERSGSSAADEYCRRVLRRISAHLLGRLFGLVDFLLICVPFGHYDEPAILPYNT